MAWTNDLLRGMAQYAEDLGAGAYKPTEAYGADDIAIVVGPLPPSPDRVIAIEDYTPNGQNEKGDVARQVQIRCRGARNDPGSVRDLRDAVEDIFDGLASVKFNGVAVQQIFLSSGTSLGPDGNNRSETSSNFTIQARRLTALRTD